MAHLALRLASEARAKRVSFLRNAAKLASRFRAKIPIRASPSRLTSKVILCSLLGSSMITSACHWRCKDCITLLQYKQRKLEDRCIARLQLPHRLQAVYSTSAYYCICVGQVRLARRSRAGTWRSYTFAMLLQDGSRTQAGMCRCPTHEVLRSMTNFLQTAPFCSISTFNEMHAPGCAVVGPIAVAATLHHGRSSYCWAPLPANSSNHVLPSAALANSQLPGNLLTCPTYLT